MRRQIEDEVLEMALHGYRAKREEIVQAMAELERQLGGRKRQPVSTADTEPAGGAKPKRKLSAAGKRAIQEAVRKRWAAFHSKTGGKPVKTKAAKSAPAKRSLSPAAKARLAANLAKARAAKASKRAAEPASA